ncbi:hypothetical protein D3C86_1607590 [compost metagenome]
MCVKKLDGDAVQPAQQPARTSVFEEALDVFGQQVDGLRYCIGIEQVIDGTGGLVGVEVPARCRLAQGVGPAREAPLQGVAQVRGEQIVIAQLQRLVVDRVQKEIVPQQLAQYLRAVVATGQGVAQRRAKG